MITLKTINIQGFGSIIKPLEYTLNKKGISILYGKNGSGKSTILNALFWVIFGSILKKDGSVTPYEDIITKEYKGTKVTLYFDVDGIEYTLIRCKDYKLIVTETNEKGNSNLWLLGKDIKVRDKKDIQEAINKLIGYTPRVFRNSILFGQNLTRIISESGPEKKKVFEEAFEVAFLQDLKDKTDKARTKIQKAYDSMSLEYEQTKLSLESIRDKIKFFKAQEDNFNETKVDILWGLSINLEHQNIYIESLNRDLTPLTKNYKKLIPETQEKIDANNTLLGNAKNLSNQELKLDLRIKSMEGEIQDVKKSGLRLKDKYFGVLVNCPRCNQVLDPEKVRTEKGVIKVEMNAEKTKMDKLQNEVDGLKMEYLAIQKKLSSFDSIKEANQILVNEKNKLEREKNQANSLALSIQSVEKEIENLETKIKVEENKTFSRTNIREYITKRNEIKPKYLNLKEELKNLKKEIDLHTWAINDPLSNKGIKAYIFDTQLALVNKELKKYEKSLGFRVDFSIDLNSANKNFEAYIFKGNGIRPYGALCGGEQQLVNVAIAFSIHDTVNDNVPINALFMDEVFEALDEENVEVVTELIKEKARHKSIHIITHRPTFIDSSYSGIKLKLKNGQTLAQVY